MLPKSKPKITEKELLTIIDSHQVDINKNPVILVGIRGYYLDSMGKKNQNDRGIYDDALIWWIKDRGIMAYNGNCDASKYRKGKGKGAEKGMASLNCGVWKYKTGIHNGSKPHAAFRQAADVVVTRDGVGFDYEDKGQFGINIHRGGVNGTSSLGCQTVPPAQWESFKALGYEAIKDHKLASFPYILVDEKIRRKA